MKILTSFDSCWTFSKQFPWYVKLSWWSFMSSSAPKAQFLFIDRRWDSFLRLLISVFPVDALDGISSRFRSSSPMLSIMVPLLNWLLNVDVVDDVVDRFLSFLLFFRTFSAYPSPDDVVEFPLSLIRCSLVLWKVVGKCQHQIIREFKE